MCGVVGWLARSGRVALTESLMSIRHRGPDAMGEWSGNIGAHSVCLGHVRLSIVDLSEAANQPFSAADGSVVVVFNGEIYNHRQLRERLQSEGVSFATHSDTEVLVHAYKQYGRECLGLLRGMFAFIIVDKSQKRMLVARDGFGIKPLYVCREPKSGAFAFASEIRALEVMLKRRFSIDRNAIPEFLLNGFVYEPNTGLDGVSKVPPGGAYEIDLESGSVSCFGFSEVRLENAELGSLIEEELSLETEADVPVGLFFSGGVDSSVLAAFSARKDLEAMFVDYSDDGEHADRSYARKVAGELGLSYQEVKHNISEQSVNDIVEDFRGVAAGTEEPISDFTYSATKRLSGIARQVGFKVMLSGMGGDEIFAGYPRHALARWWSVLRWLRPGASGVAALLRQRPRWGKRADRLAEFLRAGEFGQAYTSLIGYFSFEEVVRLTGNPGGVAAYEDRLQRILAPVEGASNLKKALHLDRYGYLAHNLTVTDKASMSESLEVRVPLLTEGIFAYGWHLDDDELIKRGSGKQPLKDLLRSRISRELVTRRKQPFNPPLNGRLNKLGPEILRESLLEGTLKGFLDTDYIRKLIDAHFQMTADNTYRLWQLLYLTYWMDERSGRVS